MVGTRKPLLHDWDLSHPASHFDLLNTLNLTHHLVWNLNNRSWKLPQELPASHPSVTRLFQWGAIESPASRRKMRVLRQAVPVPGDRPLLYDKFAISNSYSHAKNYKDPCFITCSKWPSMKSGFPPSPYWGAGNCSHSPPMAHRGIGAQRAHGGITTSLLRQNDAVTSFWRNNEIIIASSTHWVWMRNHVNALCKCTASIKYDKILACFLAWPPYNWEIGSSIIWPHPYTTVRPLFTVCCEQKGSSRFKIRCLTTEKKIANIFCTHW